MLDKKDYIEVGNVQKTFGVNGEYIVKLKQVEIEDMLEMESVFLEIDGGLVPFFVEHMQQKGKDKILVRFREIKTEERAKEFLHHKLFVNREVFMEELQEIEFNHLIGFEIIDEQEGSIGILNEIIEYPNNSVLSILKGSTEIMVPLNDEFIVKIDLKKRNVRMNFPEGLIDLYLNA